jgi:polynucleotide 5'-triphosphatase
LTPLDYTHLYLVDSFYPNPDPSSGPDGKIRVTRDERTGEVKECVKKIRLGDLNIYCPKSLADWRISVNVEVPGDSIYILNRHPPELTSGTAPHPLGSATHTRRKDRMSYLHEEFNIDLTQVTSSHGAARVRNSHASDSQS